VPDQWASDFLASYSLPSDNYYDSVPLIRPFVVSSAGTYTYGIHARMIQGAGPLDEIEKAVLVLVYYPA